MYSVSAEEVLAAFGPLLRATGNETLLAVSTDGLDEACRTALEKSAEALGFGAQGVAYAITHASLEGVEVAAGCRDVYRIVEGLDPLAVVAADAACALLLGEAYRTEIALDASSRIMGRTVVAFENLGALMGQPAADGRPAGKQVVWGLLKTMKLS